MVENFINTLEDKMGNKREQTGFKRVGLVVVALFLGFLVFAGTGCTGGMAPSAPEPLVGIEPPSSGGAKGDVTVEDGIPGAVKGVVKTKGGKGADDEGAPKGKASKKKKAGVDETSSIILEDDTMVTMVIPDTGRPNPFEPAHEAKDDGTSEESLARAAQEMAVQNAKLKYELVDPPTGASADPDAERVMTTKISGIIYDETSPSAILNIEGSDYLVRSGDVVNGYKVLAINKTLVTVQLGANIYKAGVGELLVTDGIQYNTISNLENKFGGSGRQ